MLGDILHLDWVAQIRLVGAIGAYCLVIGNARPLRRHGLIARELLHDTGHHRFHFLENVFLLDEAHLDIELVKLAGQTVGARVLVAEAGCNLKIAVETRHHQKLLILLRRLRQRVELAGMNAARHQEVARTFRARRGQDRRRELVEAGLFHPLADRTDDRKPCHDVLVQGLAAQIQEPVLQAQIFRIVRLSEHRHWQFLGLAQHLDFGHDQLDLAGWQILVDRASGAILHPTVDADHPLGPDGFGGLERWRFRVSHYLREAIVVAHVDKQQPAMVTHAVDPTGNAGGGADVGLSKCAAGMRAVTVQGAVGHGRNSCSLGSETALKISAILIAAEKHIGRTGCQARGLGAGSKTIGAQSSTALIGQLTISSTYLSRKCHTVPRLLPSVAANISRSALATLI